MNPISSVIIPVITGSGAPDNAVGVNGQTYYDLTNGFMFGPKAGGAWPDGVRLEDALYIQSRLQNLITNGSGLLETNENFSGFTFDAIETHGGGGSFAKKTDNAWNVLSNEYIPIDPEKYYRMVVWAKSGNTDGTEYDPANRYYAGIRQSDIDKLQIFNYYVNKFPGAADTTLAVALNPGDTAITLTDATGWTATDTTTYNRQMLWYGYTNSKGYTYPDYTYSRNSTYDITSPAYKTAGLWAVGGISGNVITLTGAWPGPAIPAGTAVRNGAGGATYKYCCFLSQNIPNSWTKKEGYIGTLENGANTANKFNYGCAYVQLLFLQTAGTDNRIRFSDIWFSEMSTWNLEPASSTTPGTVALANQQMGTGDKYFAGKVGINNTDPARRLDILDNAAPQSRIGYSTTVYAEDKVDANGDLTVYQSGDETFYSGLSTGTPTERIIYSIKRTMPVSTDASYTSQTNHSAYSYNGAVVGMQVYNDGSGVNHKIGAVVAGNYIEIDNNGNLATAGTAFLKDRRKIISATATTATTAVDLSTGNSLHLELQASTTVNFTNPPASGFELQIPIRCKQDSTGGYTISGWQIASNAVTPTGSLSPATGADTVTRGLMYLWNIGGTYYIDLTARDAFGAFG